VAEKLPQKQKKHIIEDASLIDDSNNRLNARAFISCAIVFFIAIYSFDAIAFISSA
jgi:hypothetical protein